MLRLQRPLDERYTDATPDELMDFCKTLIAGYKCPRSVEVTQTPLPLSGAGKILKRELRKPYWETASSW